jgi:hypothetical protein
MTTELGERNAQLAERIPMIEASSTVVASWKHGRITSLRPVAHALDITLHRFHHGVSLAASGFGAEIWVDHAEHYVEPGHEPLEDAAVYHGDSGDDVKPHLWNFFRAVKTRKPVAEDAVFGNHAAMACHMANESYFRKKPVYWDAETRELRGWGELSTSRKLVRRPAAGEDARPTTVPISATFCELT